MALGLDAFISSHLSLERGPARVAAAREGALIALVGLSSVVILSSGRGVVFPTAGEPDSSSSFDEAAVFVLFSERTIVNAANSISINTIIATSRITKRIVFSESAF